MGQLIEGEMNTHGVLAFFSVVAINQIRPRHKGRIILFNMQVPKVPKVPKVEKVPKVN